ncbi:hypothetical protein M9Y10_015552 [Tritrichomonas musculus]|uniref:Peptidase C1A papain C-terminal domain-containing protein n=1 Tax=Tritrichomonas musculus TaxID=1915356 RepID=A0ABR2L2K9_9EUKA
MGGVISFAADVLELNVDSNEKSFLYRDSDKRKQFMQIFLGENHDIFSQFLFILGYYDINLWALVITLSPAFRKIMSKSQIASKQDSYKMKLIHQYLIIEPVCRMHWLKKIHEVINSFPILDQGEAGTCWANAIAAAINITQNRILGHEIENPLKIRDKLIEYYVRKEQKSKEIIMKNGKSTKKVLEDILPLYNMHFRIVYPENLKEVIMNGRVCVARFELKAVQWFLFNVFYNNKENKTKAITFDDINRNLTNVEKYQFAILQKKKKKTFKDGGHAILLVESNCSEFVFYNSWGDKWADNGKFRVKKNNFVHIDFFDIYWESNELSNYERNLWDQRSGEAIQSFYSLIERNSIITQDNMWSMFAPSNQFQFKEFSLASLVNEVDLLLFWSCIKSFGNSKENADKILKYVLTDASIRTIAAFYRNYINFKDGLEEIYNRFWRPDYR